MFIFLLIIAFILTNVTTAQAPFKILVIVTVPAAPDLPPSHICLIYLLVGQITINTSWTYQKLQSTWYKHSWTRQTSLSQQKPEASESLPSALIAVDFESVELVDIEVVVPIGAQTSQRAVIPKQMQSVHNAEHSANNQIHGDAWGLWTFVQVL